MQLKLNFGFHKDYRYEERNNDDDEHVNDCRTTDVLTSTIDLDMSCSPKTPSRQSLGDPIAASTAKISRVEDDNDNQTVDKVFKYIQRLIY